MSRPIRCACGSVCIDQVRDYFSEVLFQGDLHPFVVRDMPIPTCVFCGEEWFSGREDEAITQAIWQQVPGYLEMVNKRRRQ